MDNETPSSLSKKNWSSPLDQNHAKPKSKLLRAGSAFYPLFMHGQIE